MPSSVESRDWASEALRDEIGAALEEFVGPERTMYDDHIQIFATWFHNDRQLAGGKTPAERYSELPALAADERTAALRSRTRGAGFAAWSRSSPAARFCSRTSSMGHVFARAARTSPASLCAGTFCSPA
jgi:hypothetical protein